MEVADKIRKAVLEDLPWIGSALGRAFFDDPVFVWAFKMTTGGSGSSLSSSRCMPRHSCATRRPTPPEEKSSRPRCGRLLERSQLAGEDAEDLGRLLEELAGPGEVQTEITAILR
jgi:hypothetical protein